MCFVEVKPKNGKVPEKDQLEIQGYQLFINDAFNDQKTRGVCLYFIYSLDISYVHVPENHSFDDSIWASTQLKNEKPTLIGCVYRSGTPETAIPKDKDLHSFP